MDITLIFGIDICSDPRVSSDLPLQHTLRVQYRPIIRVFGFTVAIDHPTLMTILVSSGIHRSIGALINNSHDSVTWLRMRSV